MASQAAREPGPLVTFVRCRTVENVDSMGLLHDPNATLCEVPLLLLDPVVRGKLRATMPNLVLDVKALYHWTYTIENFLRQVAPEVSRDELSRIGIFRHKLIVHHAETPMRARRGVPSGATAFGPRAERFRTISHPIFPSAPVWRGLLRKIGQLNPYVPGLKQQQNLWEKVNLIHRHFNSIPDGSKGSLRNWVRNDLFGSVGLTSDPPVIAHALLVALQEYRRKRHI